MRKIRLFEDTVFKLTTQDLVFGSVHFYSGEEAVAVGVCSNLKKSDYILTSHRCHGQCIAKGCNMEKMVAELMGRTTGYCKGKGGTMHLSDPDVGMMGANGIVGGGIPVSVGLGLACKNFEQDNIVVSFFGDGAINTGAFHESVNLASIWKLPVLFVCENNQYAISMNIKNTTSLKKLSDRSLGYGIKGFDIDGNDVIEVLEITKKSIGLIKKGNGPVLMVCNTYRQMGHSIHDPRTYRTKEEEESWKKKDPIDRFIKILKKENLADDVAIKKIDEELQREIDAAVEFGKKSPRPLPEELYRDVYA